MQILELKTTKRMTHAGNFNRALFRQEYSANTGNLNIALFRQEYFCKH